ncbi:MAG TPA: hypothetical protein VG477_19100 [Thermoanaerobaculia bacterium]|nr:hypothetical protein [Thermoanaerobaculia bacterium]
MKRTAFILVVLLCLLIPASPALADVCDADARPAATLLLPYFEVDLDHPKGITTVFTINNAFEMAALAHVTIWSDLSVPVFDFNVYLTGFDMEVIDLREVIVNGNLPQTASDGQDPLDRISPQGELSTDINFSNCTGQLPLPQPLPAIFSQHLQSALTGAPSPLVGGLCFGRDLGDRIARGYVTVDVVNNCTLRFPTDTGYFGPGGDVSDANTLFGDYRIVDHKGAVGDTLVHIEASAGDPQTSTPGQYTFYGRYVGWSAADHREPLPTTFGARYTEDTDLIVWRDAKVAQQVFRCPSNGGSLPAWYPLDQEALVIFDEQETPSIPADVRPFPAEAQRTAVGSAALPAPFDSGWMYISLNATPTGAGANPPEDPAAAQGWVSVVSAEGKALIGYDAVRYDNACQARHDHPGQF